MKLTLSPRNPNSIRFQKILRFTCILEQICSKLVLKSFSLKIRSFGHSVETIGKGAKNSPLWVVEWMIFFPFEKKLAESNNCPPSISLVLENFKLMSFLILLRIVVILRPFAPLRFFQPCYFFLLVGFLSWLSRPSVQFFFKKMFIFAHRLNPWNPLADFTIYNV